MTTAEMERRLVVALRSADSVPVDVATARDRWMRGETDRHQAARRRLVAAVAAAAVVAGLTIALVARLVDPGPHVPPARELTVSPSGLPVGVLMWSIPTTKEGWTLEASDLTDDVTLTVLPDGRGVYWREATGEPVGFDVHLDDLGSGRAVLRYAGPTCTADRALTLDFAIHGRSVTVTRATASGDCVVPVEDAEGLQGKTIRVRPLPGKG